MCIRDRYWLPSGRSLIKSSNSGIVRSIPNKLWILNRLGGNRPHGRYELVELLAAHRLSRFNQHSSRNNQRKIDRHWMEAIIDKSLRYVEGMDSLSCLPFIRKHHFMHRRTIKRFVVIG